MKRTKASVYDPIFTEIKRTVSLGGGVNYLIAPPGFTYSFISVELRRNIKELFHPLFYSRRNEEWRKFISDCKRAFLTKKRFYINWMFMPNRYNQLRVNTKIAEDLKAPRVVIWADLSHWARIGERNSKQTPDDTSLTTNNKLDLLIFIYHLLIALYRCQNPLKEVKRDDGHKARQAKKWFKANQEALDFTFRALGTVDEFIASFATNEDVLEKLRFIRDTLGSAASTPLHRGTTKYL